MGFLENTFHPDRKRQQNWRQFSSEVGGIFTSEGASGDDEIHIPFMDHRITVSANLGKIDDMRQSQRLGWRWCWRSHSV